jgi:hypothetical protein
MVAIGLVVLLAHFSLVTLGRKGRESGDFQCNREFGRRFLAGEWMYAGDPHLCFNYMPISALYWSPFAVVPVTFGLAMRYAAGLACLGLILCWLRQMMPERGRSAFAAIALAILLGLRYIIRDLDDGGPHLMLLAMLVGGAWCVRRAWLKTGAAFWGLSIALKMTPVLLLPFLLWRREWRLAVCTSIATALWIVLPAVWMGPASWWAHQREWNQVALAACSGTATEDMEKNDVRASNQSLKYALIHCLYHSPEGDPLHTDHAGWSLLNLNRAMARRLAALGMFALFIGWQWFMRRQSDAAHGSNWWLDFSGLLVLMLLFSPVTWVQHLVWLIPALYCIVAVDWSRSPARFIVSILLGFQATVCLLVSPELLGKQNYTILLANHVHTICMLLLLAMLAAARFAIRDDRQTSFEPAVREGISPGRLAA